MKDYEEKYMQLKVIHKHEGTKWLIFAFTQMGYTKFKQEIRNY